MNRPAEDSQLNDLRAHSPGIARICAFCDAVFAVAITLLVLNLHVPSLLPGDVNAQLAHRLGQIWYSLSSYVLSFLVIGLLWIMHHRIFRHIKRYTELFIVLNVLFLMLVVFLPFSTDLYSDYRVSTLAFTIYSGNLAAVSLMICILWEYALQNGRLVSAETEPPEVREAVMESMVAATIFVVAIGVAHLNIAVARFLLWLPFVALLLINVLDRRGKLLRLHE